MSGGTALFISPHLDDVAFSCGGLASMLAEQGWTTILATVFTRSVLPVTGFALACQLDKGLPASADYMALRRAEDLRCAARLSFTAVSWLDLLEAPHRGYETARALFGELDPADGVHAAVCSGLEELDGQHRPALVLAPQSLGNHVDHQVVTECVQRVFGGARIAFYRDTPYAIRDPGAISARLAGRHMDASVPIEPHVDRKIAASCEYTTQIAFHFGGAAGLAQALRDFATREGEGRAAERFRVTDPGVAELLAAAAI